MRSVLKCLRDGAAPLGAGSRGRAEAALVCSCPGVPLTAPTSGLCGVSLPGLALLTARGQKGTGGALPGCGQRPGAAAAEAGETRERGRRRKSRLSGQHPPPSAGRESLPLCVRREPSSQSDRQRAPRVCVRHPECGGGQAGDWSFRRRRGAGGKNEKEVSNLSNSPGSTEGESCVPGRGWTR